MDTGRSWLVIILMLAPVISDAWRSSREDRREPREPRELRRGIHYHTKRHMLPQEPEPRKRSTTLKPREIRKKMSKPFGHLTPLEEDDMENDEVVSVAIGPPPTRPKYEKLHKKTLKAERPQPNTTNSAVSLVRDILTQLGREFLTRDVNENFVFGQYVGKSMMNLTSDQRLNMQHDILDVIVRYQKMNQTGDKNEKSAVEILKEDKLEKKVNNDTEETWPDFSNLAKIVG